jgi:hypothetical protein
MSPKSQLGDPLAYRTRRRTFSAWAISIAFATIAMLSFAIDQTITLSSDTQEQLDPPSLLHPVQLIQSVIDAVSE